MAYPIDRSIPTSPVIFTRGRGGKAVTWIVVHYTASSGSAKNQAAYNSRGGNYKSSWHYCCDGTDIYAGVAEEDTAWHAGNFDFNQRSVGVEVVSVGEDFSPAEIDQLHWLVDDLMRRYGIDAAHVIRHFDVADHYTFGSIVSPHKCCPEPYCPDGGDPTGAKWRALHSLITSPYWEELTVLATMQEWFTLAPGDGATYLYEPSGGFHPMASPDELEAVQQLYRIAQDADPEEGEIPGVAICVAKWNLVKKVLKRSI